MKPKFDLYEHANQVNAHPWLVDLLIWRARRSPRLLQRMSGILNETKEILHKSMFCEVGVSLEKHNSLYETSIL